MVLPPGRMVVFGVGYVDMRERKKEMCKEMSHFGPSMERGKLNVGVTIENDKPKMNDFTTTKTLIAPDIAKNMLLCNTRNRVLDPQRVNFFAKLMKDGLFQCTPHGIIFD